MDAKHRILVIDDDQVSCIAIVKQLEKRGYKVKTVHDPLEVHESIDAFQPDHILLDIVMPQKNGLEVLAEIRASASDSRRPVLMLSAKTEDDDIVKALEIGANDYLTKPVNVKIAEARIRTSLRIRENAAALDLMHQVEAVTSLVVTYNHELNNPLTIALGALELMNNPDDKYIQRCRHALERITGIVPKIRKVGEENQIEYEDYANSQKMLKL